MDKIIKRKWHSDKNISLIHRTYKIDENVFDNIITEEQSYFLGFLTADGSNKVDQHTLEISLAERDRDIVKKFKRFLKTDKLIKYIKTKNPNHSNQYNLTIHNKHLSEKLNSLGVVKNKSKYLKEVKISKKFLKHFIRGYFDGDGHVSIKKDNRFNFNISSTLYFCKWLSKIFKKELNVNSIIRSRYKDRKETSQMLYIGGENQILSVLNWMYEDCNIKSNRKYKVYKKCKKIRQQF